MKIEIKLDNSYQEPSVIILADKMTDEVRSIVKKLSDDTPQMLTGFRRERLEILNQQSIIRIYTASGKVYASTEEGEYTLRLRLYELEDRLDPSSFVRISNSEIINLQKVKGFDLRLSGTICVSFSNGAVTYVSRRYVAKIKKILGI